MLGNAPAWLWVAVLVTPGWFAVRGWHSGREQPLSAPLTEWLPLALAIGATWTGVMVLTCGATVAALAAGGPTTVRVATWAAVAAVLWLAPFGFGWIAGRISRRHRLRIVTVVLRSGTTITGVLHHSTDAELTLADATLDSQRYALITVNRCDAEFVLRSQPAVVARSVDDQQLPSTGAAAGRRPG